LCIGYTSIALSWAAKGAPVGGIDNYSALSCSVLLQIFGRCSANRQTKALTTYV